jgi:hypothetical protein
MLWHFGMFCGHFVYFPRFGILYREKSGSPDRESSQSNFCFLEDRFDLDLNGRGRHFVPRVIIT